MKSRIFTEEEQVALSRHKHITKVTPHSVSFTPEFKKFALSEHAKGRPRCKTAKKHHGPYEGNPQPMSFIQAHSFLEKIILGHYKIPNGCSQCKKAPRAHRPEFLIY